MQVYVKAKSKKEINRRLEAGETVVGVEHKLGDETIWPLTNLPDGAVIKVWDKMSMGSPYAHAYGNWNQRKGRVK